jgi:hypothetical protein
LAVVDETAAAGLSVVDNPGAAVAVDQAAEGIGRQAAAMRTQQ